MPGCPFSGCKGQAESTGLCHSANCNQGPLWEVKQQKYITFAAGRVLWDFINKDDYSNFNRCCISTNKKF